MRCPFPNRVLFVVAVLVLLAGPLLAEPLLFSSGLQSIELSEAASEVPRPLLWQPEDLPSPQRPHQVEVQVLRGGALSLTESFLLTPPEVLDGHAVELLTSRPQELSVLRALAADGRADLTVRILVDGVEREHLPFAELDASSRLQTGSLRLVPLVFGAAQSDDPPTPLEPAAGAATACEQQCDDEYLLCIETECYPEILCETCEVEHDLCLQGCPPPEPVCPTVSYYTTTTLVSFGPTGYWQCLEEIWENDFEDGYWYEEYAWVYRNTRIRRIVACDGGVTEEVAEVTYSYFYCNQNTYLFCYYPWTWAYNMC